MRHAAIDESRFVRAFSTEIAATAARVPGRSVSSVFFGGGTPSLMQPQTIGAILEAIAQHWPIASDVEITLEANPSSVEATRFAGYRAAGVNRVSIGLQSLDDGALRALGRLHSAREGLDAIAVARSVFDRYSFDLIYARPGQTPDAWAVELECALAEAGEHLSLYQLTIEQGTPFHLLHVSGKLKPHDEDTARALYDVTQTVCADAGLPAYGVSNHARAGGNAGTISSIGARTVCRHRPRRARPAGGRRHASCDCNRESREAWLARVEACGHGMTTRPSPRRRSLTSFC